MPDSESSDSAFWRQAAHSWRSRIPLYCWIGLGVAAGAAVAALAVFIGNRSDSSDSDNGAAASTNGQEVVIYADPGCGCCDDYATYLRKHGFAVTSKKVDDIDQVKTREGVPEDGQSCHTTLVGGYVVEGHVPIAAIDKLLEDKPDIDGITLPGMPAGSPGMGDGGGPFEILSINDGALDSYMTA